MSRRALIREADLRHAIKGALAAGLRPGQFEVRADGESVSVVTYAEVRQAPQAEEPNFWDDFNGPHAQPSEPRGSCEARAILRRIAAKVTVPEIATAYGRKRSLPELDVSKLLGLTLKELDVLTGAGLLSRSRHGGGPARYTLDAVISLLKLD